jgi:hypothetical protein
VHFGAKFRCYSSRECRRASAENALLELPGCVGQFLATFKEFPPRQKAARFGIDQVMAKLEAGLPSAEWAKHAKQPSEKALHVGYLPTEQRSRFT